MAISVDRYRLLELLGMGGMGVVYRAEDTVLRRSVALKFLAADIAADEEYRARFLREARVAASLNHPNTCVVYEVGQVGTAVGLPQDDEGVAQGTPFIAMELIEGETLAARLANAEPLTVPAAVRIAVQLAEGLGEAHARQIIHRDLKPQNVMITPGGRVKIVDFGLAKPMRPVRDQKTFVSTAEMISADMGGGGPVIGTYAYMSPEQAAGRTLDARSDVFAFGIILYQMLAGRLPFRGNTVTETLAKILEAEPDPLPATAGGPSKEFEAVIWRCLRKKADDRYADARAVLRDLREVEQGIRGDALEASSRSEAAQHVNGAMWVQPRPLVLLAVLLLAFLVVYLLVRPTDAGLGRARADGGPTVSVAPVAGEPRSAPNPDIVTAESVAVTIPAPAAYEAGEEQASAPINQAAPVTQDLVAPSDVESRQASPSRVLIASVSESPPRLGVGTLAVTSAPRSSLSLDGNLTGVTPLTLEVDEGTHEVVLTGPDGLRWRGRIRVTGGEVTTLHRDLNATGSLSIVSDVWAEVSLDGSPPEQTPIHFASLPAGLHSLRVFREGYVTQVLEIVIEEGQASSLRIALEKEP